jgi:hypothetical protein
LQGTCHEANILEGGKTVHVVFKYLSRSLCKKEVGAGGATPPIFTEKLFPVFIQRRRNRYSLPLCFLHKACSRKYTEEKNRGEKIEEKRYITVQ